MGVKLIVKDLFIEVKKESRVKIMQNHSIFGLLYLSEKKAESLFSLYSFFAEPVIGTESGGVSVESVGAVIENDFHCVDSFSVFI